VYQTEIISPTTNERVI